jgi:hypothetical protein
VGSDGIFLLLLIGAIYRTTMTKAEEASGDWEAFSVYAGLVVVSAMLCKITPSFN